MVLLCAVGCCYVIYVSASWVEERLCDYEDTLSWHYETREVRFNASFVTIEHGVAVECLFIVNI